jgi:PHD/YefM family antitoxin component YafN of YafNO toxin-antitoxin module
MMGKAPFRHVIEELFLPFLTNWGFEFEDAGDVDTGTEFAIYRSDKIKLKFHRSVSDGEIDCLVHPLELGNAMKAVQQNQQYWKHLSELCGEVEESPTAVTSRNIPDALLPQAERFMRLKMMIERDLPKLHAAISVK